MVNLLNLRNFIRVWIYIRPLLRRMVESTVLLIIWPIIALLWALSLIIEGLIQMHFAIRLDLVNYWRYRHLLTDQEIARRREQRIVRNSVKRLPRMRPRALTLSREDVVPVNVSVDGTMPLLVSPVPLTFNHGHVPGIQVPRVLVDQLGHCTLWKLPLEVREVIWKYAVGNNDIHIVPRKGRLGNVYCPRGSGDNCDWERRDLCTYKRDKENFWLPTAWPRDARPLALLMTCRQIYSETIDVLYSANNFIIDDCKTGMAFFESILPSRFKALTSIEIPVSWIMRDTRMTTYVSPENPNQDVRDWQNFICTLLTIPHLETVRLVPSDPYRCEYYGTRDHSLLFPIPIILTRGIVELVRARNFHVFAPGGFFNDGTVWRNPLEARFPIPEDANFTVFPLQFENGTKPILRTFFIPFHTQCLHCREYRIVRKRSKGYAEALGRDIPFPASDAVTRYWTYHLPCGGWIEYNYHHSSATWSVAQGGIRVADDEAEAHVARAGRKRYPKLPTPVQQLQVTYNIDHVTLDTYFRNLESENLESGDMPFTMVEGRTVWNRREVFRHGWH